ncbi:hypothetical protein [Kamptonema sp. UHCC 0994]|uniref:hypothetical protein n=1 Tax=Kamptonema sp. UHCC 0994 TaxID=3031329 RepID=UPI0023BB04EA|nr:hypothetical protein [Kamptonema sp. UHCC 0994]MDF0557056.1 hypothetical protein [Kamptonema sp. UHCC 0994]
MGYAIRLTKENIDFVKSIVESAEYNAELNRDSDLGTEIGKLWHAIYGYRSDYDTFFAIGTTIIFLLIQLRENRPHEDIANCLYETSLLAEVREIRS